MQSARSLSQQRANTTGVTCREWRPKVDSNQHYQIGKTEVSRDTQEALAEVLTSEIKQQQQHFLHSSTMVKKWVCTPQPHVGQDYSSAARVCTVEACDFSIRPHTVFCMHANSRAAVCCMCPPTLSSVLVRAVIMQRHCRVVAAAAAAAATAASCCACSNDDCSCCSHDCTCLLCP
eukprot:10870-Heterococcus_DN1.PRE.2